MRLWRDNKLSQEWSPSDEELIARFAEWAKGRESNRPLAMQLMTFITEREDRGGLASSYEPADLDAFMDRYWDRLVHIVHERQDPVTKRLPKPATYDITNYNRLPCGCPIDSGCPGWHAI